MLSSEMEDDGLDHGIYIAHTHLGHSTKQELTREMYSCRQKNGSFTVIFHCFLIDY